MRLPLRALAIGSFFSLVFAYVVIVAVNRGGPIVPSTQISSLSIVFCVLLVLCVNPVLRLLRLRVLSRREVFLVFIMATVPAGIPIFGYVCQVVPLIGGLHHPEWNTPQSQWDEEVVPNLDPGMFLGAPLFQERDVRDWQAFNQKLYAAGQTATPSPARRLWEMLPEPARQTVSLAAQGKDFSAAERDKALASLRAKKRVHATDGKADTSLADWERSLAEAELRRCNRQTVVRAIINALTQRDFYKPESFPGLALNEEATELLARGINTLSREEVKRLNRYVLEAAFRQDLNPSKFLQDQWVLRDYLRGMQARDKEAWPIFVKKPEESWGAFADRIATFCTNAPELTDHEVKNWWAFYARLAHAGSEAAGPAYARLWKTLPADVQESVSAIAQGIATANHRDAGRETSLNKALHGIMRRPDLYERSAFPGVSLPPEAQALLERGPKNIGIQALHKLNQALLEAAFGKETLGDWRELSEMLVAQRQSSGPAQRLWQLLSPEVQETVTLCAQTHEQVREQRASVVKALNAVVHRTDFYEPAAFQGLVLNDDVRPVLKQQGKPTPKLTATLNRLLLESLFPKSFRRYTMTFWGEVSWGSWIEPLTKWCLIGLIFFLLFYAINELVFKQWYEREKLVFPIAQLGASVLESDIEEGGSCIPKVFRSALFWVGFAIAFSILFYNGMVRAHWIEGLPSIELRGLMDKKIENTVLQGLKPFRFEIFFTVIGLGFLLPVEISFSLWFFYLFMAAQQLLAVWLGFGVDGRSFRANWYSDMSFMTAQGGGALVVFGAVYLWRVRQALFAWLVRLARPQGTKTLPREDMERYTVPSALFFAATVALFYVMRVGNVPWGMALLTYAVILILTIALVRLVAECGLVSFQIMLGPFHLMKLFGLLKYPALFAARGLGTVMVLVAGLFMDMKTFVAPAMMNGKYLAARYKVKDSSFAAGVFLSIVIALLVSVTLAVIMAHDLGLGSMQGWFFRSWPRHTFRSITGMMTNMDAMTTLDGDMSCWFGLGVLLCGVLMYLRQFCFWLPHPIGLVMFSNNLSSYFWFSFFLAWVFKRTAVKYCNVEQYNVIRGFFIGLIMGAVMAVGIGTAITLFFGGDISISLNPHSQR